MSTLTRKPLKPATQHPIVEGITLPYNRTHELCGPSRRTLALLLASHSDQKIFWIKPDWQRDSLNAQGIIRYIDPSRITFAHPRRSEDILWCMEETLRSGCIPIVIAECQTPPALTPIRRLHLAAETGAQMNKTKLLPLLLTPGDGGSQGIETRWHMAPRHTGTNSRWLLQRRRARMAPPAAWALQWEKGQIKLAAEKQQQTIAAE